jgi:FkbM family methyltransferase
MSESARTRIKEVTTLEISLRGIHLVFSRENDWYTDEFYHLVSNDTWEPMTIAFFERNMDQNTVLIDIGAATGVLSMFAAKLGAQVIAFEPNPIAVKILEKNIKINNLDQAILVIPDAVSDRDSVMKFAVGFDSSVLSPGVMHGMQNQNNEDIRVQNIVNVVKTYSSQNNVKMIMKMDIEGAEYKILRNGTAVRALAEKVQKLYVSFHPGFNRPTSVKIKYLAFILSKFKLPLILRDHFRIFANLNSEGSVFTSDGRQVNKFREFAGLLHFGSHDWIWEPRR